MRKVSAVGCCQILYYGMMNVDDYHKKKNCMCVYLFYAKN